MSILRPFEPTDILHFNNVNADAWTATVRQINPISDDLFF